MFTNKKRVGIDTFVCAVSFDVAETPKAPIKDQEPPLPIIPFGIVAYGFVGQTFSKQLYSNEQSPWFNKRQCSLQFLYLSNVSESPSSFTIMNFLSCMILI